MRKYILSETNYDFDLHFKDKRLLESAIKSIKSSSLEGIITSVMMTYESMVKSGYKSGPELMTHCINVKLNYMTNAIAKYKGVDLKDVNLLQDLSQLCKENINERKVI